MMRRSVLTLYSIECCKATTKNGEEPQIDQQGKYVRSFATNLLIFSKFCWLVWAEMGGEPKMKSCGQFPVLSNKGLTYLKIADKMGISIKAAEAYISCTIAFLRQELVIYLR